MLQRLFRRKKYIPLNKVVISSKALKDNFKALTILHPEANICAVLKSNAYGHGLKLVAPVFDSFNMPFLIVDSLYEAYELYKLKVKTPILILGYTNPENFKIKNLPFHYAIYDLKLAKIFNEYQKGCSVHIFVDTGMHREGIQLSELRNFIKEIKKLKNIKIEGLCSHFADADNKDDNAATIAQINIFKEAIRICENEEISLKWKHISASAGALKINDPVFNMLRVGKALYGTNPLNLKDKSIDKIKLKPSLKFLSHIVQIKEINKDEKVGYSFTYQAKKKMKIAVIPAGYYEGVDRRLSNKGVVKVGKVYCPIIGRVSMNMTTIDVSSVKNVKVGDEVVIYSNNPKDKNSIYNSAILAETIPYEIVTKISESVRRELV